MSCEPTESCVPRALMLSFVVVVGALAAAVIQAETLTPSTARLCNGLPYTCDRPFVELTFSGNHNAGSGAGGLLYDCLGGGTASSCLYRNQGKTITEQLEFGIRYFDIDTCVCAGEIVTCHGSATGPAIVDMFNEFDAFLNLEENRNEVVVLTFHDQSADVELRGLLRDQLSRWEPTSERLENGELTIWHSADPYPWDVTLGHLVDTNQRIVVFVRDPSLDLANIGVYDDNWIYDTWISRGCTSSCSGVEEDTRQKCLLAGYQDLVLVTVNCSYGLCLSDLARLCQWHLLNSLNNCRSARNGIVPNFITADWTQNAVHRPNIVQVVKDFNQSILKDRADPVLCIADDTASHVGFESLRNGKMISAGIAFDTQRLNDRELWAWVDLVGTGEELYYGQAICLRSKLNGQYLSSSGGIIESTQCSSAETWRIERYSPTNDHPTGSTGNVQAGDRICLLSEATGYYVRAFDTDIGLQSHCQSDEGFIVHADWNDSDGDRVIDAGDNCPDLSNPGQGDQDGDGFGDVCDVCPDDSTDDADGDWLCAGSGFAEPMIGDQDNCPSVVNPLQVDTDFDLVGDACDCAPDDAGNVAVLGPSRNLRFDSGGNLMWDPSVAGDPPLSYDLLRVDGAADWLSPTCVETEISATTASDTATPASGGAFFYLVRARSACGGNAGTSSTGQRRPTGVCPSP